MASIAALQAEFQRQMTQLGDRLNAALELLAGPRTARQSFTVEEVARMLGKASYTVREWCRQGRINATKRAECRGGAELWDISADEIARYRDEGLLAPDPYRNAGR